MKIDRNNQGDVETAPKSLTWKGSNNGIKERNKSGSNSLLK